MVEIISKRDGPRREDVPLKKMLRENRSTIVKIADQISNGAYSQSKKPKPKPQAKGTSFYIGGATGAPVEVKLSVRISINGRVIAVDENSGRQVHHIGEIRSGNGAYRFVLATKSNGFFAPVDEAVAGPLAELDGQILDSNCTEDDLSARIGAKLGIPQSP